MSHKEKFYLFKEKDEFSRKRGLSRETSVPIWKFPIRVVCSNGSPPLLLLYTFRDIIGEKQSVFCSKLRSGSLNKSRVGKPRLFLTSPRFKFLETLITTSSTSLKNFNINRWQIVPSPSLMKIFSSPILNPSPRPPWTTF